MLSEASEPKLSQDFINLQLNQHLVEQIKIKGFRSSSAVFNELIEMSLTKEGTMIDLKSLTLDDCFWENQIIEEQVLQRLAEKCTNLQELTIDNKTNLDKISEEN